MKKFSLLSSSAAMAAIVAMSVTPAYAAGFPGSAMKGAPSGYSVWDADSENVQRDRYRGRYRHDRVDAGDVIGGLLVIGAIAAVASAVSQPRDERRYPARYPVRTRDYRGDVRYNGGQGIDRAADMCVREIERNSRVDSLDAVQRSGDGWLVTGSLFNGDVFTCRIGQDGRIDEVSYGERAAVQDISGQRDDDQWTDERYVSAWGNAGAAAPAGGYSATTRAPSDQAPAYPGGPVPGENYESDPSGADDRYGN